MIAQWSIVTKAIIEHAGGLGSRLHSTSNEREFIAYARWPSREVRERAELPEEIRQGPRRAMHDCCESIEELYELTPVADFLQSGQRV